MSRNAKRAARKNGEESMKLCDKILLNVEIWSIRMARKYKSFATLSKLFRFLRVHFKIFDTFTKSNFLKKKISFNIHDVYFFVLRCCLEDSFVVFLVILVSWSFELTFSFFMQNGSSYRSFHKNPQMFLEGILFGQK